MDYGDIQTFEITKKDNGAYMKSFEVEWLKYLGFTDKEIESGKIKLVIKADISTRKGLKFIGIGRPEKV